MFRTPWRHGVLSFEHHRIVTSLPIDIARDFLLKAEENGWSVSKLRNAIKEYREEEEAQRERERSIRIRLAEAGEPP